MVRAANHGARRGESSVESACGDRSHLAASYMSLHERAQLRCAVLCSRHSRPPGSRAPPLMTAIYPRSAGSAKKHRLRKGNHSEAVPCLPLETATR
jgi:hypothetical protein